uniref:Isoform 2 of Acyl-CoA dehydrogenase family member 11 n=1 Tax=Homo sapiens TaxID=9606 RepID=Q709F0-2
MKPGATGESDLAEVLPQHKFDSKSLEAYLNQHLSGFGAEREATLTIAQYRAGKSNPTFYLQKGFQTYVLRKKPPGSLLPKAHQIDREFKVQKALFSIGFPVPKPILYCSDTSVIGTEFYVMEHVQGRIFRDLTIPGLSPAERSAIYVATVETLAQLHSLNIQSLQLEGYGIGAGYCKRQVSTWTKQYQAAAHQDIPAMQQLSEWLMKNLPDNDNEENLIHGDFRLDNIVFHPKECRVIAVLDWELSTIGHPLSDLAHFSLFYFWPRTVPMINQGSYSENSGIPSMEELISIYCRCRGINSILPNWNFFLALSYFKMAGIAQGVYSRYLLGNNSSEDSFLFANIVQPLAETGLQLSKRTFSTVLPQIDTTGQLFVQTRKGQEVLIKVKHFMKQHILPAEKEVTEFYVQNENSVDKWGKPLVIDKLKEMAKVEGLWNLFLPAVSGLSHVDYALIAEETGKCFFAPDVFNCQAPDTGNMEVLHLYGSEEQKKQWLEPLLQGNITSCFCMTEPDVASSDATNIECSIQRDEDSYVINGKKWWSSGAGNPKCKIAIVLGRTQNTSLSREVVAHWIAESRIAIEKIRLLTLKAAHSMDTLGSAGAKKEIAMIKVAAPRAVSKIVDWAIQVCGGAGVSQDYPLANMYAITRVLRLADGPDEVHLSAIATMELRDQAKRLTAKI